MTDTNENMNENVSVACGQPVGRNHDRTNNNTNDRSRNEDRIGKGNPGVEDFEFPEGSERPRAGRSMASGHHRKLGKDGGGGTMSRDTRKGVYYFGAYTTAKEWAIAHDWPINRIIQYGFGWAVQWRVSGRYAGPEDEREDHV